MWTLLLAALLVLVPTLGSATTWYVSNGTNGPVGVDSVTCNNATNINTPKRNIGGTAGAAACAQGPGDIIDVRGGTYTESFKAFSQTLASGAVGNPITLQGHPGETVWLQFPAGTCTGIDFGASNGKPYWKFLRINLDGRNMSCGASTVYAISLGSAAVGAIMQDLECKDASNNGGGGGTALCAQAVANNILITNVHMHGTHKTLGDFQGSYAIYVAGGNNTIIEKSIFHDTGGWGVQFNDSAFPVGGWTGNIFRYNTMYNTGLRSGAAGGLVFNNAQNGAMAHSNVIYNVRKGNAIDVFGGGNVGVKIYNNTIVDSSGTSCIAIGSSSGAVVRNNICKNNAGGISIASNSSGAIVDHNILHGGGSFTNSGTGGTVVAPITTDPKLTNISTHNYTLLAGSSAIDAGVNLTATVPFDVTGVTTFSVPMEIGAYNYGTTVSPLHLAWLTPPTTVVEDTTFSVVVEARDATNALSTTFTNVMTIAKATGTGVLGGTLTCTASGGSCTFTNLTIDTPDTFTLVVSATGADPVTSSPFAVLDATVPPPVTITRAVRILRVR